jgi:hypothetical protein
MCENQTYAVLEIIILKDAWNLISTVEDRKIYETVINEDWTCQLLTVRA